METVGIRELKANLSRYLHRVKAGESILVTERKRDIAVLMPCGLGDDKKAKILDLVQRGRARWSGKKPSGMVPRVRLPGVTVSDAVLEDRR